MSVFKAVFVTILIGEQTVGVAVIIRILNQLKRENFD